MSIATDESHCNSFVLAPICFISKAKYFYSGNISITPS